MVRATLIHRIYRELKAIRETRVLLPGSIGKMSDKSTRQVIYKVVKLAL